MTLPSRARLLLALGLLVLALAGNAAVTYRNFQTLAANNTRVAETTATLDTLGRALSTLTDAETGQRGYLLTGEDRYLVPYRRAVARIGALLDDLRRRAAGRPGPVAVVDALTRDVAAKLAEMKATIDLRKAGDLGAALGVVVSGEGIARMDAIRAAVDGWEAEEQRLLLGRVAESRTGLGTAVASFVAATALCLLLAAALYVSATSYPADRRRYEDDLRAQAERWWVTLASIGDAVIVTDAAGRVDFMNPVAEALCGATLAGSAGRPLGEVFRIVNERTRETVESPVAKALREGAVVGLANHTVLIARDGTERAIDDSAAPVRDASGAVAGVVLVFRDVEARRRAEREFHRAKEEAVTANQAKDAFLAALSHELRMPLTPVLMAVSAMESDPRVPPEVHDDLRMIRRNVELEARLIDDLLDLSRITQGKMPLHLGLADAHTKIRHAVEICRGDLDAKGLALRLDLRARRHFVRADPARLQQVFWNLIKNAVKFTPDGGAVTVATEDLGGDRLRVTVSDTGVGIEPALLPRLFQAFEQGGAETTRRFGGLGLGLAISRAIVDAHGGTLSASSPGRGLGATFTVELGHARSTPEATGAPEGPAGVVPRRPLRILLVDDHADTLHVLSRMLRALGHEVVPADSVAAALRAGAASDFDLLLSDVGLPDGNGMDLARRLRTVPAIALTGYGMEDDVRKTLAAGFLAHLTKPVDAARLEAVIDEVASRLAPDELPSHG